jgi:hypothetical protein
MVQYPAGIDKQRNERTEESLIQVEHFVYEFALFHG